MTGTHTTDPRCPFGHRFLFQADVATADELRKELTAMFGARKADACKIVAGMERRSNRWNERQDWKLVKEGFTAYLPYTFIG